MLIFTVGERQLINRAINAYGNDSQRAIWKSWANSHPRVRRGPAEPWDDGTGPIPAELADAARSALNQMFIAMTARATSAKLSEDEIADLNNDLSEIRSVGEFLSEQTATTVS
jgi:hypothetical protein